MQSNQDCTNWLSGLKKRLPFFLTLIALLFFVLYGRFIWYPILIKIRGDRTVAEVIEDLNKSKMIQIDTQPFERLIILGLKAEKMLEVWGVSAQNDSSLLLSLPFTGFSGKPGPKLREGDKQIPEGIYRIEYLNPNSSYHLSMKLNYPNAFDQKKGKQDGRKKLGYDIFIHGKTATIGCIPVGDEGIERLFHLVASIGKDKVEVIIAPYDMRNKVEDLDIPSISWEEELYAILRAKIQKEFLKK